MHHDTELSLKVKRSSRDLVGDIKDSEHAIMSRLWGD